eukprot:m.159061 g.159061  ORF g.159061 m.159061 type:complete len:245 (-) comp31118_c2_seq8:473-1207(-)
MPKGEDGRGRGIAFVEFDSGAVATKAIAIFNNTMLQGRAIGVSLNPNSTSSGMDADSKPKPFKTRMCQHFINGSCRAGDTCSFAHHVRELKGGAAAAGAQTTPRQAGPPGNDPGDWTCPCGNLNFARRFECNRCRAPKPQQHGAPPFQPQGYGGGMPPPPGNYQGGYAMPPPPGHAMPPQGGMGRGRGAGGRGRGSGRPGDWDCPGCGNHNFSNRMNCNRCQTAKPYSGARGKSGVVDGGFTWK